MPNPQQFSQLLSTNPNRPYDPFNPLRLRLARFTGDGQGGSPAYQETVFMPESAYLNGNVQVAESIISGVEVLAYAASITPDASLGNHLRLQLTGNTTFAAPVNVSDGQKLTFELVQNSPGGYSVSWASAYDFGSLGTPSINGTPGTRCLIGFVYSADAAKWLFAGITQGF